MKRRSHDVGSSLSYFEETAGSWRARYDASSAGGHALRERRARLLEMLGHGTGDVLDVGCGPAVLAPDVHAGGWRYIGIDGAVNMAREAAPVLARLGEPGVVVADARALPFVEGHFGAAFCVGVLDRVQDQPAALREMIRVVRPGGALVVSFPNRRSPFVLWSQVFRPVVGWTTDLLAWAAHRPRPLHLNAAALIRSPGRAKAMVAEAGATPIGIAYSYFNPILPPVDQLLPGLAARLTRRLERLHTGRWAWLGANLLIAARRDP